MRLCFLLILLYLTQWGGGWQELWRVLKVVWWRGDVFGLGALHLWHTGHRICHTSWVSRNQHTPLSLYTPGINVHPGDPIPSAQLCTGVNAPSVQCVQCIVQSMCLEIWSIRPHSKVVWNTYEHILLALFYLQMYSRHRRAKNWDDYLSYPDSQRKIL